MTLREFLTGELTESDVQALGFENTADCKIVVDLENGRIDPDGPCTLVTLDHLRGALAGEKTMFFTKVRNYRHFQREHYILARGAPAETGERFFDAFVDATNTRLTRQGYRKSRG